jgi:hypothetical protein
MPSRIDQGRETWQMKLHFHAVLCSVFIRIDISQLETPLLKVSAEWHSQLDGCDTVTKI